MQNESIHNTGEETGRMKIMEAIVAEHETALLRYAARIVNSRATAQDVVQNVFIKLAKSWKEGDRPSKKLKGWLFRVTHNEAVDFVRRESRMKILHTRHAEEQNAACPDGVNCHSDERDRKAAVLHELRKLDLREQQVILLRLEQGMSYREIASVTGRSVGNVGKILHEGVGKLAGRLGKSEMFRARKPGLV